MIYIFERQLVPLSHMECALSKLFTWFRKMFMPFKVCNCLPSAFVASESWGNGSPMIHQDRRSLLL